MQSPPPSERLPLLLSSNNRLNVALSSPRINNKRKSDDVDSDEPDPDIFTATFLSTRGHSLSFVVVTLLARACLPLAWLNPSNALPSPVFESTIGSVQEWEQRVLVARKSPNGGLYAVERVGPHSYLGVALHSWVSEEWCRKAAMGIVPETRVEDLLKKSDGVPSAHQRTASNSSVSALPTPKSPKKPTHRRGALARMSILAPKDWLGVDQASEISSSPSSLQPTGQPVLVTQPPSPIISAVQIESQIPLEGTAPSKSTVDAQVGEIAAGTLEPEIAAPVENPCAHERLRSQYFEHLYTSKTSLAFYVKGPLSRARAHVRAAECPSTAISELLAFYDECVLSTKKIDLKYKESLSNIITILATEAEDGQKRKSRKKKQKLGKDCLWPDEAEYIFKWWRSRDLMSTLTATHQAEQLRGQLADLRMRETKMQMLLILEILLLKLAVAKLSESQSAARDPDVKIESVEDDDSAALLARTPHKQSKKTRDFANELETIVDRLCIWHTVSLDELASTEKSQNDSISNRPNEPLRDFCKDVLLPFYSAKLPNEIKSLSRKLGGPEISPKRPQLLPLSRSSSLLRNRSLSSAALPASQSKPTNKSIAKRTLERVLSEDHLRRHSSPPPTLVRSSTVTLPTVIPAAPPTLKREPSERPLSRGGMLSKSMSFSNREIDLVADSKAHEAKRRKLDRLALQKRELEAAIDALKRPSRSAVAGAFMDEVEGRTAVQITATPRARRVRDQADMAEPELPPMPKLVRQEQPAMMIPSSTRKCMPRPGMPDPMSVARSSSTKRAVLSAIHETPSRGIEGKTFNPLALAPPTLSCGNDISVAATPARRSTTFDADVDADVLPSSQQLPNLSSSAPRSHMPASDDTVGGSSCMRTTRSQRLVLFTPITRSDVRIEQAFRDAPEIPERAGKMMDRVMGGKGRGLEVGFEVHEREQTKGPSGTTTVEKKPNDGDDGDIYDRLGWNDDFDDL